MKPESEKLRDYLVDDEIVDWKNPSVLQKAMELTKGLSGDLEKAQVLVEWVRDEIPHTKDIDGITVTCSASEVLSEGTGICYAKSHLLAALLRANNIPAGFCYQVLRRDSPLSGMVLHGLNGIYIESLERWIRVDARGNTNGINAQFSIEKEQLAFPVDASLGEFIYETIFVAPAKTAVDVLQKYNNRKEMWPDLPESI